MAWVELVCCTKQGIGDRALPASCQPSQLTRCQFSFACPIFRVDEPRREAPLEVREDEAQRR